METPPHITAKNKECSRLWYEWYELFQDPARRRTSECQEARKRWSECANEANAMIAAEVDPEVFAKLFGPR
jgi:hypothetical protein